MTEGLAQISGGIGGLCSGSQARGLCVLIVKARAEHVTIANLLVHGVTPERPNRPIHMGTYSKPNTARREQRRLVTDRIENGSLINFISCRDDNVNESWWSIKPSPLLVFPQPEMKPCMKKRI
jgi:hypothetical protein